jgi:hypothetical protein
LERSRFNKRVGGEAGLRAEPAGLGAEGFLSEPTPSAVWSEATQTKVPYGVYPIVSGHGKQENRFELEV